MFIDLRKRGGRQRERKRNIDVREKYQLVASQMRTAPPRLTTHPPATKEVYALTSDAACNLFGVWDRATLQPMEPPNQDNNLFFRKNKQPWLVWLSGLSAWLRTKGLPVPLPVRAHAWVAARSPAGGVWEATTHWCFSPCLPPCFPLCLKTNKLNLKKKKKEETLTWSLLLISWTCYLFFSVFIFLGFYFIKFL